MSRDGKSITISVSEKDLKPIDGGIFTPCHIGLNKVNNGNESTQPVQTNMINTNYRPQYGGYTDNTSYNGYNNYDGYNNYNGYNNMYANYPNPHNEYNYGYFNNNARHIVKVRLSDDTRGIQSVMLDNGSIISIDDAVTMAQNNLILGVIPVEDRLGRRYLRSYPDGVNTNDLKDLPKF